MNNNNRNKKKKERLEQVQVQDIHALKRRDDNEKRGHVYVLSLISKSLRIWQFGVNIFQMIYIYIFYFL